MVEVCSGSGGRRVTELQTQSTTLVPPAGYSSIECMKRSKELARTAIPADQCLTDTPFSKLDVRNGSLVDVAESRGECPDVGSFGHAFKLQGTTTPAQMRH